MPWSRADATVHSILRRPPRTWSIRIVASVPSEYCHRAHPRDVAGAGPARPTLPAFNVRLPSLHYDADLADDATQEPAAPAAAGPRRCRSRPGAFPRCVSAASPRWSPVPAGPDHHGAAHDLRLRAEAEGLRVLDFEVSGWCVHRGGGHTCRAGPCRASSSWLGGSSAHRAVSCSRRALPGQSTPVFKRRIAGARSWLVLSRILCGDGSEKKKKNSCGPTGADVFAGWNFRLVRPRGPACRHIFRSITAEEIRERTKPRTAHPQFDASVIRRAPEFGS